MRVSTITTIGSFTDLSPDDGDWLRLVPSRCTGHGDADLRVTEEDAPGQDGVFIEPPLDGARVMTFGGDLIITSDGSDPGYFTAMDTLYAALKAALDGLKTAAGDLTSSEGTIKVWKHGKLDPNFDENSKLMAVTFGLVEDVFA